MVKNVLIVDDDQEMLVALENGFKKYRDTFTVETAVDGKKATNVLKNGTVSLVVTDLKMPGLDGFGLLQHIMQHYPHIPVIVITGYSTPTMEKLARNGGAVGYIAKPFMLDSLAKKIMLTLRKETEGGTLHSVSSGIFLQLMEMEQKTCTIRIEAGESGKKGVLFFDNGDLLDARVNDLQAKEAALEIFSWNEVSISIQNVCPPIDNRIQCELQALMLEASRLKDEAAVKLDTATPKPEPLSEAETVSSADSIREIKVLLDDSIGPRYGLEDIYKDSSWTELLQRMTELGDFINVGQLQLGYFDKGESFDYITLPGADPTVLMLRPKCPRDKIIQVLVSTTDP
jgi:DNA-binding response OmpR family regulator